MRIWRALCALYRMDAVHVHRALLGLTFTFRHLRANRVNALALTAGLWLVAAPASANQPELTLEEVARLALEQQPNLDAYTKASIAASEVAIAEGKLPDPQFKFGVQNLPVTRDDAFRLDRDEMTMLTVGIMQEVVREPVRAAAAGRMQAESEQLQAQRLAEARRVMRDAKLAWVDAFDAAKRASLLQRMGAEVAAEREIAMKRISSGSSEARDLFQLDVSVAMTNDKRLAAENIARKAQAQLSRWLGSAAFRPLPSALPEPRFPELKTAVSADPMLASHPQLAAMRKTEEVARFEAERARAERSPNWSWELMYGKRQDDRSDMVTLQFALPLQWNRADRQDRRLAEKLALADRAQSLTLDRERELNAELAAAMADRATAEAREREHVDRLIPAARARLETTQAGYAAGKVALAMVWEARRGVLDAEMEHWMIQSDLLRAALRLEYLLGGQEQ